MARKGVGPVTFRSQEWADVLDVVVEETGISVPRMRGKDRTRRVSCARKKAIRAILKADGAATQEEIGKFFNRSRETISYLLRAGS